MAAESLSDLKPVYLIHGSEELLLERAVHRLRSRLAEHADLDFNYVAFDGDAADPDEIVAAANTMPFMSERKLVVVRDVDRMPAAAQAVLAAYASDPSPFACLVLTAGKVDKGSKLYKAVAAAGAVAEYTAPKRDGYVPWVADLFREHGKTVGADAAEVLVRAVGRDLRRLSVEVEKVCAYSGDATTLTRDDIEAVMSTTAPTSVFDFLDAVGARDCRTALRVLSDLLEEGEQLLGVHAMTLRHVRNLLSVRSLVDRGMTVQGIEPELGMQRWQARNLVRQAGRFELSELTRALVAAAEAERKMKTSQEPRLVFERWLVSVCGSGSD